MDLHTPNHFMYSICKIVDTLQLVVLFFHKGRDRKVRPGRVNPGTPVSVTESHVNPVPVKFKQKRYPVILHKEIFLKN